MFESFKDFLKFLFPLIIGFILVSFFLIILLNVIAAIPKADVILGSHEINHNVWIVHAAAIIILTIVLICVGWLQLGNLNKTSKADFLLRIDGRYGSVEIVKARAIIQRLYRAASPPNEDVPQEIYFQKIADSIDTIRDSKDKKSCEEFSYLLNLLDFLETIAYFSRKEYISVRDIDELIGNSILFYFRIYRQWIYYRRRKYGNKSYYCEFENLVEKIESHQAKEKLAKTCFIIRFLNYFY